MCDFIQINTNKFKVITLRLIGNNVVVASNIILSIRKVCSVLGIDQKIIAISDEGGALQNRQQGDISLKKNVSPNRTAATTPFLRKYLVLADVTDHGVDLASMCGTIMSLVPPEESYSSESTESYSSISIDSDSSISIESGSSVSVDSDSSDSTDATSQSTLSDVLSSSSRLSSESSESSESSDSTYSTESTQSTLSDVLSSSSKISDSTGSTDSTESTGSSDSTQSAYSDSSISASSASDSSASESSVSISSQSLSSESTESTSSSFVCTAPVFGAIQLVTDAVIGEYVQINIPVDPNLLNPPQFIVDNLPSGMSTYQYPEGDFIIYGTPDSANTFLIDVTAYYSECSELQSIIQLTLNIALPCYVVSGTNTQYDGTYTPDIEAYVHYSYDTATTDIISGPAPQGPKYIFRNTINPDLAIFWHDTYQLWALSNLAIYNSGPPEGGLYAGNYGAPPIGAWYSPMYSTDVQQTTCP